MTVWTYLEDQLSDASLDQPRPAPASLVRVVLLCRLALLEERLDDVQSAKST